MSSGFDSGGKGGDGGKAKKGGGFLDGLRSFGSDFLDAFARNMGGSVGGAGAQRSAKPTLDRRDPVAVRDRPIAARQIQRRLKIERQADDEEAGKQDAAPQADEQLDQETATAGGDEAAQDGGSSAASEDALADTGEAGKQEDASPEGAPADADAEKKGDEEGQAEAEAASEEEAKPSLSVAAKLKGVHRKVFLAAKPPAAPSPAADKTAFKPKSAAAGSDTVESFDSSGKPGLKVAGKPGSTALDSVIAGPLSNAKNKAGLDLAQQTLQTVSASQASMSSLSIADGKVSAADQKIVDAAVDKAASAVSGMLRTMKIQSLARAMTVGDGLPAETVAFASQKSENEVEREQFKKELERQVEMQSAGLNKLTLDDWSFNINVFGLDQAKFETLHQSARLAVLNRLKEDAQGAVEKARTKKAEKEAALKELQAVIEATKKGETKTPDIKDAKKLGIGGREGDEKKARAQLEKQGALELIKKEVTEWSTLIKTTSDIAVLHNPDQVAGGGDGGLHPIPVKPSGNDPEEMKKYVAEVKKLLGAGRVNGSLGVQWDNKINDVYKNVTGQIDQTAWPLFRLNLKLTVE